MRYFLDCEFNGYRGELISLALVREDGQELYLAWPHNDCVDWVAQNVIPIIECEGARPMLLRRRSWPTAIQEFMACDDDCVVVADWPDDIRYFCECLITGPGEMVKTAPTIWFAIERVDAYPTNLPGAVQHNALWDARALRYKLTN